MASKSTAKNDGSSPESLQTRGRTVSTALQSPWIRNRIFWDELNYCVGVSNILFSAWFLGAFPWLYWTYYAIKVSIMLVWETYLHVSTKRQFWLLEYCYVVNVAMLLYFILSLAKVCPYPRIAFRVLFTSSVGPLLHSIPAFRNSLVFHSSHNVFILAIHWSPNVAVWGMRWWSNQLENKFPGMFSIDCPYKETDNRFILFFSKNECSGSFVELYVVPLILYLVIWAIPYYLFFFIIGKNALKKYGYFTMFDDMMRSPAVKKVLSVGGEWGFEAKYMMIHATCCSLSFFAGPILWHSFILHSLYLILIISVAVYNGGTFYFKVFAKKYYQQLINDDMTKHGDKHHDEENKQQSEQESPALDNKSNGEIFQSYSALKENDQAMSEAEQDYSLSNGLCNTQDV